MPTNYEIIMKKTPLTLAEYFQIYNSLIKNKIVHIPFNIKHLDKIINRLRYLSKSSKASFGFCPRSFDFGRIKDIQIPIEQYTYFDVYGKNLHLTFDKVWNKLSITHILKLDTEKKIMKYIYIKCRTFVPSIEKKLMIYKILIRKYAEYEAFRINNIINEIGNTTRSMKYIKPLYRELQIENHEINEAGIIDVIHLLTDDTCAIVDYKTGSPKYYNKEIDGINYDKKAIDFELGSYYNLILGMDKIYKVINKNGKNILEDLEFLNIKKGLVLYIRDWKNTFIYIPLHFNMIYEVTNIKHNIIEAINSGFFKLNMSNKCFDFCRFIDICLKDKLWEDKWKKVDYPYKQLLDYIFRVK